MDSSQNNVNISIGPQSGEFTPGFQIEGHSRFGDEFDREVAHMSEASQKAAIVFGVKFTLHSEGEGAALINTLNMFKGMGLSPSLQRMVENGTIFYDFRHEGTSVYANVCVNDVEEEFSKEIAAFKNFSLQGQNFSGKGDFKLNLGVNVVDAIEASVDQCSNMITNFSFDADFHGENMGLLTNNIANYLNQIIVEPRYRRPITTFFRLLQAMKLYKFSFKYDPSTIKSVINSVMAVFGSENFADEYLKNLQKMVTSSVQMGQGIYKDMLGPFGTALNAVNLGHFEFFLMVPKFRAYVRPGFTVFGLDEYLHKTFPL